MYIVIRYDHKHDIEKIVDVVGSYQDMVHYQTVLLERDPRLRQVQTISEDQISGRCVPIATGTHESYYIQYQTVVTKPSF